MPASNSPSDHHFVFRLPRRSLRIAGIALGAGVLLALLAMWLGRDKGFYTVPPVAPAASGSDVPTLPEPMAAGGDASGMQAPPPQAEKPQVVETPPPAMPTPVEEAPQPAQRPVPERALAAGDVPTPIPGQNPPPEYPARAMRSGETGTVVVRAMVGPDGVPTDVSVGQRSGSRDLDRAAVQAVRDWRFKPAQRDGQAITASVDIPIDFKLEQR